MNQLEIIKLLNRMYDDTRTISLNLENIYLKKLTKEVI